MTAFTTLSEMIARQRSDAIAITAPSAKPLSYGALNALVGRTVQTLNGLGIGRGDRVGLVLPNCPEMATAFVAVAGACTCAPLNMAYRADEFEFYLSDLNAKALIVAQGSETPARAVAAKLGIAVIELLAHPERGAGDFELVASAGAPASPAEQGGPATTDDVALILHTSGTTSRPKIVPLSHRNVCASARNISQTLQLTESDIELHIMPLFHIHGLIAGVLAPMAGQPDLRDARLQCAEVLWLDEGVQTQLVHRGADHAPDHSFARGRQRRRDPRQPLALHPLVVIVHAAAGHPELEQVFKAPLIESYGMTEAAPDGQQPAAAGQTHPRLGRPAAGPEVAIMDNAGNLLPPDTIGEIVIRGENVTAGYENNPKANAEAYTHGWFRTGDQGTLTPDGYLTLTGRLKEIINRGGEKISPREVDEVLMDHPAVAQVVTFAMPHAKLGEDVAAAVVLREGMALTERELRDFAATKLADFKVPRKILFLAEIPKGATGKLQRIGLAEKLGLTG
jgi:acyl-CoA synthetase (AMP-forming)/AMP-acid ligase II